MKSLNKNTDPACETPEWFNASYARHVKRRTVPEGATVVDVGAIVEVVGLEDLQALLRAARIKRQSADRSEPYLILSRRAYARLLRAIRQAYGPASRGILNRIGRIAFRHFVEERAEDMAAISIALRLMPLQARKVFILRVVARTLNEQNQRDAVHLEEEKGRLMLVSDECSTCQHITSDEPVCWHSVGFIEEALQWATGQEFRVEETACRAQGHPACHFVVAREPNAQLNLA